MMARGGIFQNARMQPGPRDRQLRHVSKASFSSSYNDSTNTNNYINTLFNTYFLL